ncbi:MAG: hypothetical protein RL699_297 [Bacteroidota bacterium]
MTRNPFYLIYNDFKMFMNFQIKQILHLEIQDVIQFYIVNKKQKKSIGFGDVFVDDQNKISFRYIFGSQGIQISLRYGGNCEQMKIGIAAF